MKHLYLTLAFVCLALASQAQRLGGLPDGTFNKPDDGTPFMNTSQADLRFYQGPGHGVVPVQEVVEYVYDAGHGTSFLGLTPALCIGAVPRPYQSTYQNGSTSGAYYSGRYFYLETRPGKGFLAFFLSSYSYDTLSVARIGDIRRLSYPARNERFVVPSSFRPGYKHGMVEVNRSFNLYWHTNDIATNVQRLDTALTTGYFSDPVTTAYPVHGFKALAATAYADSAYMIGRRNGFTTGLLGTQIQVVYMEPFVGARQRLLPGLDTNLLAGEVNLFDMQAGRTMLVGGKLNVGGRTGYGLVRLTAAGALHAGFTPLLPPARYVSFSQDSLGVVRAGYVDTLAHQAVWGVVDTLTGAFTQVVRSNLDARLPEGKAVMYHTVYRSFLFESGDLMEKVRNDFDSTHLDPSQKARHRFWVDAQGRYALLDPGYGIDRTPFLSTAVNNKVTADRLRNRLVVQGYFANVNNRLQPRMAVLKPDGTTDTTYPDLLDLPPRLSRRYMSAIDFSRPTLDYTTDATGSVFGQENHVYTPGAGGRLIVSSLLGDSKFYYVDGAFDDTVRVFLPSGALDPAHPPFSGFGHIIPRRNGSYALLRYAYDSTLTGIRQPLQCVQMNAEGGFAGVLGTYQTEGAYPDTAQLYPIRTHVLVPEDNQENLWLMTRIATGFDQFGGLEHRARIFFTRLTGGVQRQVILPDSIVRAHCLSLEVLADGRVRLTGRFMVQRETRPYWYSELVTDAQGAFSAQATVHCWAVPDIYGGRGFKAMRLVDRLPDGKFLGHCGQLGFDHYNQGYVVRFYADGRFDPSYLPSFWGQVENGYGPVSLGNQAYWGTPPPYSRTEQDWLHQPALKNGIWASTLANRVADRAYVSGRIDQVPSPQAGCAPAGPRRHSSGMVVLAEPSRALALTDTGGFYTMATDTGRLTVHQELANNFLERQVCPPAPNTAYSLHLGGFGQTQQDVNFINQTFDCPRLALSAPGPRFRLCAKGQLAFQYLNDGTATEPAARLRVSLPRLVRVLGASKPYAVEADSSYVFELGALAPGQGGTLYITDSVGCTSVPDSISQACFSARLEPMAVCGNIDAASIGWSGAWLDGEARYVPALGQVRMVLRNRGAAMTEAVPYTLYDGTLRTGSLRLAAGDSLVLLAPPSGPQQYLTLTVQQPAGCPLGTGGQITHAGRGLVRHYLTFGPGLWEAYTVQECPTFRYSYDPNEKLSEPSGDVEPGTRLTYTIHFENYGNDTAYTVAVADTLPQGLDPATFKMLGASHACTPVLEGTADSAVLMFYFSGIKLTGHRQDSVRSQGAVSFSIATKAGVARGTEMPNRAAIYFDNNPPVLTGYTQNRIADDRVTGLAGKAGSVAGIRLWPNPARTRCRVQLSGAAKGVREVLVYNGQGRLVANHLLTDAAEITLQGMAPGLYTVTSPGLRAERLIILP